MYLPHGGERWLMRLKGVAGTKIMEHPVKYDETCVPLFIHSSYYLSIRDISWNNKQCNVKPY